MTLTLHGGQINYLFVDGHVEDFSYDDPITYGDGNEGNPYGMWTLYPDD